MPDTSASTQPQINLANAVISMNQTGGQTARLIQNIGQQQRKLPADEQPIIARLSKFAGTENNLEFAATDGESHRLAMAIGSLVKEAGWVIKESSAALWARPPSGVIVRGPGEKIDDFEPAMRELGSCLKQSGIETVAEPSPKLEVVVGFNPSA